MHYKLMPFFIAENLHVNGRDIKQGHHWCFPLLNTIYMEYRVCVYV